MSNGGARAKEQGKQEEREQGCYLPAELKNDFYADVILIHSETDEELAKTFLLDIRKHFKKGDDYTIVSYLDEKLRIDNADGCDFKRCSVAFFLFTEKSVNEFSSLTKDKYLDNLLYDGKFVPVFAQPREQFNLPMRVRVPVSVNYFKQTSFQFPRAVLDLLQKHSGTRCAKEERHKEQVSKYLADRSTDQQPNTTVHIQAKNVIVGDHGTIVDNTEGENGHHTNSTRTRSRKSNRSQQSDDNSHQSRNDTNPFSEENTAYPSDYNTETAGMHQNIMSMQTPDASMNYSRERQKLSKTSNRSQSQSISITSTPSEDFAPVGERHELPVSNARNLPQAVPIFPNEELNLSEGFGSLKIASTRETSIEETLDDSSRTERNPTPQPIPCDQSFKSDFPSSVSANSIANSPDLGETPNIPRQSEGRTKESSVSNDQMLSMKVSNVDRLAKTETPWSSHRYDRGKAPKEVIENTLCSYDLRGEGLDVNSLLESKD